MTAIEVVELGWSTTVQDAGRPGLAHLGVPPSGALDARRCGVANRLVGNPADAAVIETAGGLRVRATGPCVVALTAELAARTMRSGDELVVGPADGQLWGYLAVRGGICLDAVLGSTSQDTLSGLGPPPLEVGQHLVIGPEPDGSITLDQAPIADDPTTVGIWPGPRLDRFVAGAWDRLLDTEWLVSGDTSRVGVRLDGPPLGREDSRELPSEGVVTGAVQVPPDGRPVVMLADHPTTGGYPVIAVVDPRHVSAVAQRRPGSTVRFGPYADWRANATTRGVHT